LTGHREAVTGVVFTPDGHSLVSAGLDRTVRLWDLAGQRELCLLGLHEKRIWGVSVSPDGRWAISQGYDHMAKLWDLRSRTLFRTFRGHQGRVTGAILDGDQVFTSGGDGKVRVWKVPATPDDWCLTKTYATTFGFACQKRLLLGLEENENVDVWDVEARKRIIHAPGSSAVWLPNTERFAFRRGGRIYETDASAGEESLIGEAGVGEPAEGAGATTVSHDGRLLAWGYREHAHIFDRGKGKEVVALKTGDWSAQEIAFSPDDAMLATGGGGTNSIQLWDTKTWHVLKSLTGHQGGIKALAFSPNGSQLASSSQDRTARLWDIATGQSWVLENDEGESTALAFAPDARTLAIGTFESSVKLWNTATLHQITSFEAGASVVYSVAFAPDGSAFGSTTMDGTVRVWRAPSWEEIEATEKKEARRR
jgi:WD40 repeat protein